MSRNQCKQTAQETVEILERGHYTTSPGESVDLSDQIKRAREGTVHYSPDQLEEIVDQVRLKVAKQEGREPAEVMVENTTTLTAAREMVEEQGREKVLALNFASARNPGGGFLNGSQAQEESLARASALYPCLADHMEMYEYNRHLRTCLYSHHMIYSPGVPVFRDDHHRLLEKPYPVSFITAPAVNAGVVRKNTPQDKGKIEPVMRERMERVLAVAVVQGYEYLVLGAWGCGVFRCEPEMVARLWEEFLGREGRYRRAFGGVRFAVLDRSKRGETIGAFQRMD